MTVCENVAFGLRRRGDKDVERAGRTRRSSSSSSGTLARPQARAALRRAAAARGAGPRARQPARRAAARRAARRPRPQAAPPDADRAQAHPDGGRPDVHPRHPRPGGGHDDGRHHRGDERRPDRAAGRARRRSTSAAHDVRRQLPRPVQPAARPKVDPGGTDAVVAVACHGTSSRCRATHAARRGADVWLGVRPEKLRARRVRRRATTCGGVVPDVSFIGRRDPVPRADALGSGAHRRPAERRLRAAPRSRRERQVSWAAEHDFALDASQAADAGAES